MYKWTNKHFDAVKATVNHYLLTTGKHITRHHRAMQLVTDNTWPLSLKVTNCIM